MDYLFIFRFFYILPSGEWDDESMLFNIHKQAKYTMSQKLIGYNIFLSRKRREWKYFSIFLKNRKPLRNHTQLFYETRTKSIKLTAHNHLQSAERIFLFAESGMLIAESFSCMNIHYGAKWMPWLAYPMKDVQSCDKLGGAATTRYYSEISEWGNPFSVIRENP